jgi:sarcosine oxidase, subunit beta
MAVRHVEVAVIGGGVIGSSIAYHLARQGRSVLVIERAEVAASPAASWASAGGVRRQGRHAAEAALASEAIVRWHTLEAELEADMQYRHGGQLLLAESDAEADEVAEFVARQHALGFGDVRLVDRREALELAPGLNERVRTGSYSPADGQANPLRTTRAFVAAAERLGAEYWTGTACHALLHTGARVSGVATERGDVLAEQLVLAAGAWSDPLAASVGLLLPVQTRALQMVRSTPGAEVTLRPVLSALGRPLSLKQPPDGAYLLGGGWLGDPTPDGRGYTLRASSQRGNWDTACELYPPVAARSIDRAWCGLEALSFDGIPLVGPAPDRAGLTLALGFTGHGFALAPAVGRAVADQLTGRANPELDGLSPARIAGFDGAAVAAFRAAPALGDYLGE